jgi:sn1-specific diacylglycerol lipase
MWEAALRVGASVLNLVTEALANHPTWELVITGHSLGAGVGTLLALQWHHRVQGTGPLPANSPRLRCYAFAPPCTMSLPLARAARSQVTSVVLRDDFVCRYTALRAVGDSQAADGVGAVI